jgi:pimeloyl-ACP methyl ester carboxylesterase
MGELMADVSGTGSAIVLLHGQPGSRGDWAPLTRRLQGDFRVIAPDRPGYGQTGGRARGFRGNAAAVLTLLDRLAITQATVVGFSWGGGVAVALAELAPERVSGLVLVSSVGPGESLDWLDRLLAMPRVGTPLMAVGLVVTSAALSLSPVRRAVRRRNRAIADDDYVPEPKELVSGWRANRVWHSVVTEQRSLIDELPLLEPGLSAIGVPTVVMVGGADRTVPPDSGRRVADAIPGARLVEVAGAGHLLAHEHPDHVAAAVREVAPH